MTRPPVRSALIAAALLAAVLPPIVIATGPPAANANTVSERLEVRVIDGDTVEIENGAKSGERVRIANIDTAEMGARAGCDSERALAQAATDAVRERVAAAQRIDLNRIGEDRYGRTLAHLSLDGRDLGDDLIAAGLARPWRGAREPWCGFGS